MVDAEGSVGQALMHHAQVLATRRSRNERQSDNVIVIIDIRFPRVRAQLSVGLHPSPLVHGQSVPLPMSAPGSSGCKGVRQLLSSDALKKADTEHDDNDQEDPSPSQQGERATRSRQLTLSQSGEK